MVTARSAKDPGFKSGSIHNFSLVTFCRNFAEICEQISSASGSMYIFHLLHLATKLNKPTAEKWFRVNSLKKDSGNSWKNFNCKG